MKLYYYEFETSVFSPWEDCKYELQQGYLLETPFGILQYYDDQEMNEFRSVKSFKGFCEELLCKNLQIVEL